MKCIKKVLGDQATVIRVDDQTASFLVKEMEWVYCPKKYEKGEPTWSGDIVKAQNIVKSELAQFEQSSKKAGKDKANE